MRERYDHKRHTTSSIGKGHPSQQEAIQRLGSRSTIQKRRRRTREVPREGSSKGRLVSVLSLSSSGGTLSHRAPKGSSSLGFYNHRLHLINDQQMLGVVSGYAKWADRP